MMTGSLSSTVAGKCGRIGSQTTGRWLARRRSMAADGFYATVPMSGWATGTAYVAGSSERMAVGSDCGGSAA